MEEPDRGQGKAVIELNNGKQEKTTAVEVHTLHKLLCEREVKSKHVAETWLRTHIMSQEPVPCYACCLASHHPLPESPSLGARLHHALLCPPHGPPALLITYSIALATIWAVAYCLLGQVALPGTKTIEVNEKERKKNTKSKTTIRFQSMVARCFPSSLS